MRNHWNRIGAGVALALVACVAGTARGPTDPLTPPPRPTRRRAERSEMRISSARTM